MSLVLVFCRDCLATTPEACLCPDHTVFTCAECEREWSEWEGSDRSLCDNCYRHAGICDRCDQFARLYDGLCGLCGEDDSGSDSDATVIVDLNNPPPSPVPWTPQLRPGRHFRPRAFNYATPSRTPSPEVLPSRRRRRSPSPEFERIPFATGQPRTPRSPSPPRRAPSPPRRRPIKVYVIDDAPVECGVCYGNARHHTQRCCECRNEVCGACFTRIIVSGKRTCPYCRAPNYY